MRRYLWVMGALLALGVLLSRGHGVVAQVQEEKHMATKLKHCLACSQMPVVPQKLLPVAMLLSMVLLLATLEVEWAWASRTQCPPLLLLHLEEQLLASRVKLP